MKYIIENDLSYIKKFFLKKIFLYLVLLIGTFKIIKLVGGDSNFNVFLKIIGVSYKYDDSFLEKAIYILDVLAIFYMTVALFVKDLKNGKENIFLRIKLRKWILYKLLSISLIILIVQILIYIVFSFSFIFKYNILQIFFKNLLYNFILEFLIILFFISIKSKKVLLVIMNLILCYFVLFITILDQNILLPIVLIMVLIILLVESFMRLYLVLFEN